ncbi:MAG: GAF domain-containing protein [Chloroflexi bacterium]|nr:GAF domain-containing protein [Chloroflexota bacterium]
MSSWEQKSTETREQGAEGFAPRREMMLRAVGFAAANLLQSNLDDEVIAATLARLAAAAAASRAYIFANELDDQRRVCATLRYEWHAPGIVPLRDFETLHCFSYDEVGLGRWVGVLSSGGTIVGPITDLPPAEQQSLTFTGWRSRAIAPIFVGGRWWGFAGFSDVDERREWDATEQEALKLAARLIGAAMQRHDEEEQLRRRALDLALINRIVAAANRTYEPAAILETICRELAQALNVEQAGAALIDESGQSLEVVAEYRAGSGASAVGEHIPLAGNALTRYVMESGRPVVIEDVANDSRMAVVRDLMARRRVASMLLLPILVGEEVVGTLGLDSHKPHVFTPEEIALASGAATAAAPVLQKAHLLAAEQRNAARLEEILTLSTELAAQRDESALLKHLVQRVRAIAGSDTCTVFLADEETQEVVLAAQEGLPGAEGLRIPRGVALLDEVAAGQLVAADVDRDWPELRGFLVRADVQSIQVYPLSSEGTMFGFITIGRAQLYQPSPSEVNGWRLLADRAGAALRSVRLLEQLRQQAAHLQALHEVELAVSTSLDPEVVYGTIVRRAAELLESDVASLLLWDGERQQLVLLATCHEDEVTIGGDWIPVNNPDVAARLQGARRPLVIEQAADDPCVPAHFRDRFGVQAVLYLPLRYRDRLSGMLVCAQTRNTRSWQPEALGLGESLAVHAANAIANARLHEATRRLLQRTRHQAQVVQQILDTVPTGLLLLDGRFRLLLANPTALELLPFLTDAKLGQRLRRLGDVPVQMLVDEPPVGALAHEVTVREPRKRIFEISPRPMLTGPQAGGWLLVLNEVTAEREQQRYMQTQDRLATVGQLAAGIAHDFNNIMAVIVLYAQTLLMSKPEGREHERLTVIFQQAQRASRLIGQILDFSRKSVVERRPLDVVPFTKELVRLLQRTLPETIDVDFAFTEGDYVVEADPTRLQQALMNLAVNARDAMPDGGTLTLSLSRHGPDWATPLPDMPRAHWVCIEMRDTGDGIVTADLPHVFEPFYSTKEPGKGTGLGLAQVYGIVKQHDGFIHVVSRVGHGTAFQIFLPSFVLPPPEPMPDAEGIPLANPGETVLVVEDEESIRQAVAATLDGLGYRVLTAPNGEVALAIFRQGHENISLVLTDMIMPRMGGAALYEALRAIDPGVHMLVITGYPLEETNKAFVERSGVSWVQKPFTTERLAQAVRAAIDSS